MMPDPGTPAPPAPALPAPVPDAAALPAPEPPAAADRPVLYSFRRCPFAIRARLALAAAGWRPGPALELREVRLRAKPPELLALSPQATLPALQIPAGAALCQSLEIMDWALDHHDPEGWSQGWSEAERQTIQALIAENDGPFKRHLDGTKYARRDGAAALERREGERQQAWSILRRWNARLEAGGWLLGSRPSLADIALLPFVRQFRLADPAGFNGEPNLEPLRRWLGRYEESEALARVMAEPWGPRSTWRSPSWLYHLALRDDWQRAKLEGHYAYSSRGLPLEQVGFLHASLAHQVEPTRQLFYADLPAAEVLLLAIDPARLGPAGVEVRLEPAPQSGELFPHLNPCLPLEAVIWSEPIGATAASHAT
jgi:glutathione S-transferase